MTKRKLIAGMLAEGQTNKEIAAALHISVRTVKWYLADFRFRLGLYGNADERRLVVAAVQGKLV